MRKNISKIVKKSSVTWPTRYSTGDLKVEEVKNIEDIIFKVTVDLTFPKVMKV